MQGLRAPFRASITRLELFKAVFRAPFAVMIGGWLGIFFLGSAAKAEPKSFICKSGQWQGTNYEYVTIAIMHSGAEKAFMPHTKAYGGLTLAEKCRVVTQRLNAANEAGRLRYLTWGEEKNSKLYICTTSQLGAVCEDTLFSLFSQNANGSRTISELGKPNENAIKIRSGKPYLSVSELLDPNGSECGQGMELKDDVCQKKPDPPCPEGAFRSPNGQCMCPPDKVQNQNGSCSVPVRLICGQGTVPSPDGRGCVPMPTPMPTPLSCPAGWGMTPSGCMPQFCPIGMVPSSNGCVPQGNPYPNPNPVPNPNPQPTNRPCPPGMAPWLCVLLMPRN